MKIGTMLSDVATSLFRKPVTERYPFERRDPPENFRGCIIWTADNCTGCGLCAMDCPANAIEMIVLDKKAKRFVMHYHVDRCTFCAQCVHSCRQECLKMDYLNWELASPDRKDFELFFGKAKDIHEVMEREPGGDPLPTAEE